MRIVLIAPPFTSCYAPLLGPIALTSHLRRYGIEVLPIDASIEATHALLSPRHLRDSAARRKLERLWSPDGLDLSERRFARQIELLDEGLSRGYERCRPARLRLGDYAAKYSDLHDESRAPFVRYYREMLFPQIESFSPDIVALSLSYTTQILPALALLDMLRARFAKPIITGGSLLTYLYRDLSPRAQRRIRMEGCPPVLVPKFKVLYHLVGDFCVLGEGEAPLLQLCRRISEPERCRKVPGVIWKEASPPAIVGAPPGAWSPPKGFPPLDLQGWPVGRKYATPIPIAPLEAARGCYWRRCAFCDHSASIGSAYREIPLETVTSTLNNYHQAGVRLAMFCQDAMPVSMMRRLTGWLTTHPLDMSLGTMCRFEKGLLPLIGPASRAGFRFLSFGLESGSPRIVRLMDKGFSHGVAQDIMAECAAHGVFVHLFVMFGFPTETEEDAAMTFDFLERHRQHIHAINVSRWVFEPGSPVARDPERFGLERADPGTFVRRNGITEQQADACAKRLREHPHFKHLVSRSFRHQEYFMIQHLCGGGRLAAG